MNLKTQHVWTWILFACAGFAVAAEQAEQSIPIQGKLFPPEFLMQHREEIGLTDEQLARIRGHLEQVKTDATAAQEKVGPSVRKLGDLLGAESIDEAATLKQLDEVLDAEREMKRLHLRVMIRIRNELTAKQQSLAIKLIQSAPGDDLRQRLESKVARIQKEVQRRAEAGQPPVEAIQLMQTLPEEMRLGRHKEAEAILDRVLKMLDLEKDAASPKNPIPPPKAGASQKYPTPSAVIAEVQALEKKDVAWRGIPWKTCLIDGLAASRQQNKPIMLWIFIDRPIDDQRC